MAFAVLLFSFVFFSGAPPMSVLLTSVINDPGAR